VSFFLVIVSAASGFWAHRTLSKPFRSHDSASILIIGVDQPQNGSSRADTILLVHVKLRPQRRVTVLSLPRDTRVKYPGGSRYHKLNAAFSRGGAALTRATVVNYLGLPVDHVLVTYSGGMASLVDALGGVDVHIASAMDYDDNAQDLHIHLKPGNRHLDGKQAVGFVRFRGDGLGDVGRIVRQQQFLKAMVQQHLNARSLVKWWWGRSALSRAVETDLVYGQIAGLVYCCKGLRQSEITTATLPGRTTYLGGVSYYLADPDKCAGFLSSCWDSTLRD
jgi:LCP family protein required for cell wall assembly